MLSDSADGSSSCPGGFSDSTDGSRSCPGGFSESTDVSSSSTDSSSTIFESSSCCPDASYSTSRSIGELLKIKINLVLLETMFMLCWEANRKKNKVSSLFKPVLPIICGKRRKKVLIDGFGEGREETGH